MAVMDDLISESSNVVGVSSTGQFLYKEALRTTHRNAWPFVRNRFISFCVCKLSILRACSIRSLPPCGVA